MSEAYNASKFAGRQIYTFPNLAALNATATLGGINFGRRVQITRIGFAVKTLLHSSVGAPVVQVKQGSTAVSYHTLTTLGAANSCESTAIAKVADSVVESDETLTCLTASAGTGAGDGHIWVEYEELFDVGAP